MLEVLLLGPVEVRRDGSAMPLGGAKQQAILARLALAEDRVVPVPVLVEDLWGADPPADPAHALQAHVSRLRRVLPVGLEWVSGGYRLDAAGIRVDLDAFEELAAAGRERLGAGDGPAARRQLREALALWRGPALGRVAEVEGLRPLAVRLEELRDLAIGDRVEADLRCGADAEVVPELRGLLAENPLRERHWGQLMVALFKAGRANEAIDAFRQARDVFVERLGTEPGRDLHRLHESLLRGALPEEHVTASGATTHRSAGTTESVLPSALSAEFERRAQAPLAGRRHELTVLDAAWEQAGEQLRVVTLSGDPGIGKTRLAAEFAAHRVAPGTRVLFGRNDRSVSTPYQPFVEMLRTELVDCPEERVADRLGPAPTVLATLVPDRAAHLLSDAAVATRDANIEQHLIFDALAGWLEQTAARGPLLVVVDDVQWADHQTLLFLRHLTRTPRRLRLMLLTTLRDRGLPGEESADHLFETLLRQSETTTHLHLDGLDDDEVSQLLHAEVASTAPSGEVDPALVAWASNAAGGNPLFVVELARGWGALALGDDTGHAPALPVGLREVVRRRLDDLPDGVRDLLQQAAVIGSTFELPVLERVSDRERAQVDALVQQARHARLLASVPGSPLGLAFSHEVVRGVLLDMLPPWQRIDRHRRIAEAIETVHARRLPDHYRELSHHYVCASADGTDESVDAACRYLRLTTEQALAQGAPWLAVEDARRLLDLLGEGADVGERCDALTQLGVAQFHAADATYRDTLLEAARLAHQAGDRRRLAEAVVANSRGWWSDTTALDDDRLLLIEAALETDEVDDPALRALLLSAWAQESVRDPARRELAVRRSRQALEVAEEVGDDAVVARVLSLRYAVLYASFSDPWECVDISERLFELAGRRADPRLQFEAAIGLAQSAMMMGEFTVTDRALERCAALGEVLEQPARVWLTRCWQSMCVAMRGDLETAEQMAVAALELGTDSGQPDALTWFAGQLFTFRMLQGRLPELYDEIETQVAAYAGAIPAWRAAHALAMTTVGREREAEIVLEEFAGQGFAQLPTDLLWLHGMSYLCGVCHALGRSDLAPALYRTLAPYAGLVAHNGTIDAGPVDLHLARMARLAGWPDVAEKHRDAAVQLCRRIDAPLWLAQARSC